MNFVIVLSFIALQCFNVNIVIGENISKKKCDHYRNKFSQLSEVFNDNNEDAALKEFPFMARIENVTNYVNGILISEKFVLTLASYDFVAKYVIIGDLDMISRKDDAHSQYFEVAKEFTHPQYSRDLTFDLKLLMLNVSVDFNEFVRPACLPQSETPIPHQLMEVGWSRTNFRDNTLLHKVKLDYISNAMCREKFKFIAHQKKLMEKIDKNAIFCAMAKEGDRDMCLGFFGSALLNHNRNSFNEVIGIALTNTGCNDTYPTVFLRISASLSWIESVVWPDEIIRNIDATTMLTSTSTTNLPSISTKTLFEQKTDTMRNVDTTTSTTEMPSNAKNLIEQKTILISVTTILTITIISLILCIVGACFHMNRSRNTQQLNLNIQFRP